MKINIEDIKDLIRKKRRFNRLKLKNIIFYENGKKLNIPPEVIEEWEITGLNNVDFVDVEFWKARNRDRKGE